MLTGRRRQQDRDANGTETPTGRRREHENVTKSHDLVEVIKSYGFE